MVALLTTATQKEEDLDVEDTGCREWRVVDMATGEIFDVKVDPTDGLRNRKAWYGYEPPKSVWDAYSIMTRDTVIDRGGDRTRYGGASDEMKRRTLIRGWGKPQSAEDQAPQGWAADWFTKVLDGLYSNADWLNTRDGQPKHVPPSGVAVARQLARLAGDEREVTIPERSLADAVGRRDKHGRHIAYTQRGVKALTQHGFVEKHVSGRGRGAETTYRLIRPD